MTHHRRSASALALSLATALFAGTPASAETAMDKIVAAASKEHELIIVGGGNMLGGAKGVEGLQAAMNKRFNIDIRLEYTPGPPMPAMAARVLTEFKAGRASSTDVVTGAFSHFIAFYKAGALEEFDWVGTFPWVTPAMQVTSGGIVTRTGFEGIIYNPAFLPPDKAPKSYEDLTDPKMSAAWKGTLAIAPYPDWLTKLAMYWGEERVKTYTRDLVSLAGGVMRYGPANAQPLITGQFPLVANEAGAFTTVNALKHRGVNLTAVLGSTDPVITEYTQMGVPKNSAHPNLAKLFIAFSVTPEAQAITERGGWSSYLVPTTRAAKFVRDKKLRMDDPKKTYAFFATHEATALQAELYKMLRR